MNNSSKFTKCLITLFHFYKTGDFQTFKVILHRTFDYLDLNVSEESYKRISYILFNRLTAFGILETANHKGRTMWEFCGPIALQISDNEFFFIADQVSIDRAIKNLGETSEIIEHILYTIPEKYMPGNFSIIIPRFLIKNRMSEFFATSNIDTTVSIKKCDIFRSSQQLKRYYQR